MFDIQIDPVLWSYGLTISTIFFCALVYVCINLYRKIKIYEAWVVDITSQIHKLQDDVKDIDSRGIFENDDEVGTIYSEISDLIQKLDHGVVDK